MTLSSNNNVNVPRINIPRILLSNSIQAVSDPIVTQNTDLFVCATQEQIPNIQPAVTVGPPNPQGIQQRITQLAQALSLTFNEAQRYYTDNAGAIYYPQLNGSFYVTGRRALNGDPIQPLTVVLNQRTNQPQNQPERSQPLLHTMIIRELRLVPNNNWTFTSTLHPNVTFRLQLDGSVWGSNRTTYRLGDNNTLVQQQNSEPLPFTTAITQLGLYPLRLDNPTNTEAGIVQGAFMKTGDPGMYIPQPDGTIFYTGRINPRTETDPGGPVGPYVYRRGEDGVWSVDRSDSRRSPMVGSLALASIKAYQGANGNWLAPSDDTNPQPYLVRLLPDGRIIKFRTGSSDQRVFVSNPSNNTWSQSSNRSSTGNLHSDPAIRAAIFLSTRNLDMTPQLFASPIPEFDRYVTALRGNLQNNGCTNIQVSSQRFAFGTNDFVPNSNNVAQLVSFTRDGVVQYRLLVASMYHGQLGSFKEFDFPRSEVQRLATLHSMPQIDWNNNNQVLNHFLHFFRFTESGSSSDACEQSFRYGFAQVGDIVGLRERECYSNGHYTTNPITVAIQRLGQNTFNSVHQLGGNPINYTEYSDHPCNFCFRDPVRFRRAFNGDIGTPITNAADITRRDQIIQRFNTVAHPVRHANYSYTQGGTNYIFLIGDNGLHVIQWRTGENISQYNYSRTSVDSALISAFGSDRIPTFRPSTYATGNSPGFQENLGLYSQHLRLLFHSTSSHNTNLRYNSYRSGSSIEALFTAENIAVPR